MNFRKPVSRLTGYFVFLLLLPWPSLAEVTVAQATFNMHGIRGYVLFSGNLSTQHTVNVEYRINIGPLPSGSIAKDDVFLVIREFPVPQLFPTSETDPCSDEALGIQLFVKDFQIGPLRLNETLEGRMDAVRVPVQGANSIRGRSILMVSGRNRRVCATISVPEQGLIRTAVANIQGNIVGSIYFRQYPNNPSDTTIYTDLYKLIPDGLAPNIPYNWMLMTTGPMDRSRPDDEIACRNMRILFDPDFRNETFCSTSSPENCKVGNLLGKFGPLPVGTVDRPSKRAFFTDSDFPLVSGSSSRNIYIALFSPRNSLVSIACGQILPVLPKLAQAFFNQKGVQGVVKFRQNSQFDSTEIYFDLKGLNSRASKMLIHEFPHRQQLLKSENLCTSQLIGKMYDPLSIVGKGKRSFLGISMKNSIVTTDQFAIGDLSSKYGDLSDFDNFQKEFVDELLPLFGSMSVVGRPIVLLDQNKTSLMCSNIWPEEEVVVAQVQFFYTVGGTITMVQSAQDWHSPTFIFGNLFYTNAVLPNGTSHHPWRIHSSPILRDAYSWDGRCVSAADVFNPLLVDTRKNYTSECKPTIPARCQLGDQSAKLPTINIALTASTGQGRFFFTDTFLPLSGPFGVLNKSLVIYGHDLGDDRIACGNIGIVHPVKAISKDWIGMGKVDGAVMATQTRGPSGLPTLVNIGLQGLGREASDMIIHLASTQPNLVISCTEQSLGGEFNPFDLNTTNLLANSINTTDAFPVGDLSARYGTLLSRMDFAYQGLDSNLPLIGPNSIIGRSIGLSQPKETRSYVCADIVHDLDESNLNTKDHLVRAIAQFTGPFLWGYMRFSQVQYGNGGSSEMTIQVRLAHMVNGSIDYFRSSGNHRWDVHQLAVSIDSAIIWESFRCISAGLVDNYFNTATDSEDYRSECWIGNVQRCAYGDIHSRLGPLQISVDARQVFTDPLLQMRGNLSIIGRSVVIHDIHEESGQEFRYACANIVEEEEAYTTLGLLRTGQFNSVAFEERVAAITNLSEWNVIVRSDSIKTLYQGSCTQVQVNFRAPNAEAIMRTFTNYMDLDQFKYLGYDTCDKRKNNLLKRIKADNTGNIQEVDDLDTDSASRNNRVDIWLITLAFICVVIFSMIPNCFLL